MDNIEKVKEHFRRYNKAYIYGSVSFAGIACIIMRRRYSGLQRGPDENLLLKQVVVRPINKEPRAVLQGGADRPIMESTGSFTFLNRFFSSSKFNNNTITTNINKYGRGYPGYITKCIDTNELFETQGAAARHFNIPEQLLSAHINGKFNDVDGLHFERLGIVV